MGDGNIQARRLKALHKIVKQGQALFGVGHAIGILERQVGIEPPDNHVRQSGDLGNQPLGRVQGNPDPAQTAVNFDENVRGSGHGQADSPVDCLGTGEINYGWDKALSHDVAHAPRQGPRQQ